MIKTLYIDLFPKFFYFFKKYLKKFEKIARSESCELSPLSRRFLSTLTWGMAAVLIIHNKPLLEVHSIISFYPPYHF